MLNLHNLSEEISNAQIEKASRIGEVCSRAVLSLGASLCKAERLLACIRRIRGAQIESSTRSTNRSFKKLILEQKATPEAIYETICNQTVDLVFTAHPTQVHQASRLQAAMVMILCCTPHSATESCISSGVSFLPQALRQSLLKKYTTVRSHLDALHNSRMSAYEKAECLESIRAQIQAAWRTDEIRRSKPSPQVRGLSGSITCQRKWHCVRAAHVQFSSFCAG